MIKRLFRRELLIEEGEISSKDTSDEAPHCGTPTGIYFWFSSAMPQEKRNDLVSIMWSFLYGSKIHKWFDNNLAAYSSLRFSCRTDDGMSASLLFGHQDLRAPFIIGDSATRVGEVT
jgi:hypothetical protein